MKEKLAGEYKYKYERVKRLIYDEKLNTFADKGAAKDLKSYLMNLQNGKLNIEETDEELCEKICRDSLYMSKTERILMCLLFPSIFIAMVSIIGLIAYRQVIFKQNALSLVLVSTLVYSWRNLAKKRMVEASGTLMILVLVFIAALSVFIIPDISYSIGFTSGIFVIIVCILIIGLVFGVAKYRHVKWMKGNNNG